MRLEIEGQPAVESVTAVRVRSAISKLRSYGPQSYASLTDEAGQYVQVAGGGICCLLERRDEDGQHFRAYKAEKSEVFADGTRLAFSGGEVAMMADEWMTLRDVEAVFVAFINRDELPDWIMWRDISDMFGGD